MTQRVGSTCHAASGPNSRALSRLQRPRGATALIPIELLTGTIAAVLSQELSTRYYTVVLINLQTSSVSGINSPAYTSPFTSASHVGQSPDGHNAALPEFHQVLDMKRDGGLTGVSVVVMSPFKQQQPHAVLTGPPQASRSVRSGLLAVAHRRSPA